MRTFLERFDDILQSRLVPEYCQGAFLASTTAEFRPSRLHFGEEDARHFVMGWEAELIAHDGGGKYKAPRNSACEKFFNVSDKSVLPRTFTLAQEAVLTVGVLARLRFDFGWPKDLLGTQSVSYAFDAIACLPEVAPTEYIACEVKKTPAEVENLLCDMQALCAADAGVIDAVKLKARQRNALKKIRRLRQVRAPIFWAVGPCGVSKVFRVSRRQDGSLDLLPDNETALMFPA